MFKTIDKKEKFFPKGICEKGERFWGFVLPTLTNPWFYMVFEIDDDEEYKPSLTILIDSIGELSSLIANSLDLIIKEVYLVSPGYLNNSELWKMQQVESILIGDEPDLDHQ